MTHDDVRKSLEGMIVGLAPGLAKEVLARHYGTSDELALRVNAVATLIKAFTEESKRHPEIDGLVLLQRLEKTCAEPAPAEGPRGPSIWERVRSPTL